MNLAVISDGTFVSWMLGLLLVVGYAFIWLVKEIEDYHPYRDWRGKRTVTIAFARGPLDNQVFETTKRWAARGQPLELLVSRSIPSVTMSYTMPCKSTSSDYGAWMVVTYVPAPSWYGPNDYRYNWARTCTADVSTCEVHDYHITTGAEEQTTGEWTKYRRVCSLDDPSAGQIISRPTPPLTPPVPVRPVVTAAPVPKPIPWGAPRKATAADVAAIAKETGLDTGTSQKKK